MGNPFKNVVTFALFLRVKYLVKKSMKMIMFFRFTMLILKKKIHALVIPKDQYTDLDDFVQNAKEKEIYEFFKAISHIAKMLKVSNVDGGYRTLSNIANNGGQEVPHLHFHIFGGEKIGKMVS